MKKNNETIGARLALEWHRLRARALLALSPVWLLENKMNSITRDFLTSNVAIGSSWLDVGCGLKPFSASFIHAHYIGIDVEESGRHADMKVPDQYFDGIRIPYEDSSFDGILCTQVLEHVSEIDLLLAECNRVVKMGGNLIVSVPFFYREHEQPYDFRRLTSYGLASELARNGFEICACEKYPSAIETLATVFSVYCSNNIGARNRIAYLLVGLLITIPILLTSMLLAKLLPDNKDTFCHVIAHAIKVDHP